MKNKYEMNMCSGNLWKQIPSFALPLILTGILQLLYNAADMVVVGKFAGNTALAAVGSTAALIALFVNLFLNISAGVGVSVAQNYGAGREDEVNKILHTAILFSLICGVAVAIAGFFSCRTMLEWMGSPPDVIDQATIYMKIYFLGSPVNILYNFGASALRSIGDTRRPMLYLTLAGLVNVVLNLFFVIVCGMDVDGVALATVISQMISAILVVICLMRSKGCCRLELKKLRIHGSKLKIILRLGLPAGLQSTVFCLSNILIQSAINSFGSVIMAGSSVANNLEMFCYTSTNAVNQAGMCFVGQNVGGRKYDRIKKITVICVLMNLLVIAVLGGVILLNGEFFLGLYADDPQVIAHGLMRLFIMIIPYPFCAFMELFAFETRGMNKSLPPVIISIFGICVLRVVWLYTVFAAFPTMETLYISYPITWIITTAGQFILYLVVKKRLKRQMLMPSSL